MNLGSLYLLTMLLIALHNLAFLYADFIPNIEPILGILQYVLPAPYKLHHLYASCGFIEEAEYQAYVWTIGWLGAAGMVPWLVRSFNTSTARAESNLGNNRQIGLFFLLFQFLITTGVSVVFFSKYYLQLSGRDGCPDYSLITFVDALWPALMCPTTTLAIYSSACLFVAFNRTAKFTWR